MKSELNEEQLLKGLARNDKKIIESIYKNNYNMIQSMIIHNSGSADDAKDIFQEAMIILYEKARSGNLELNCQIKTYIYAVSRRLWLKRLNQTNRFVSNTDLLQETIQVETDLEEHDDRNREFELLDKAISSLGEPCKSLLEAFYFKKKNMQEISSSFGYTNADNAKNQKYKCLMRLKKIFFDHYNNDDE